MSLTKPEAWAARSGHGCMAGCWHGRSTCTTHQSWPTTNNAQNMVPCAIQYIGHAHLKHKINRSVHYCRVPFIPPVAATSHPLTSTTIERLPGVDRMCCDCHAHNDGDVPDQIRHRPPRLPLEAVGRDGILQICQRERRCLRQISRLQATSNA